MEEVKEQKFVLRLDWQTLDREELRSYINGLHSYLMDFSTASIHDVLLELDNVARIIASDLGLIASGRGESARFLTENKDDKQYERVIQLVKMAKDWQEISNMAKALRPDFIEANSIMVMGGDTKQKETVKVPEGVNIFEFSQKKATENKGK